MTVLKTSFETTWVIVASVVILVAYDIYAYRKKGWGNTISEVVATNSLRHPMIPFLVGVLMGHFFWPQVAVTVAP